MHEFSYLLEDKFFMDIDGDQVREGKVDVSLRVKRSFMMSEMDFQIKGVVKVLCDRCLDEMDQPIDTTNHLVVKFGREHAEERLCDVMSTYEHLFRPLRLAGLTLKNRLLSAPTSLAELGPEEHYSQANMDYYRLKAAGGCAPCPPS